MFQDTKEAIVVEEQEQPMFSEEFLRMVQDHAYETLRKHLEKTKQDGAVKLLDDLIILSLPRPQNGWVQNQILSEAIGQASHHVLELGGRFYALSEMSSPYQ